MIIGPEGSSASAAEKRGPFFAWLHKTQKAAVQGIVVRKISTGTILWAMLSLC